MLVVAAVAALAVIMTVLIPTIAPLFTDAGVEPPFIIGFLLGVQEALAAHWLLAAVGRRRCRRRSRRALPQRRAGACGATASCCALPLVSGLVENGQTAVMTRTLGTLLRNGVPMLQALQIAGDVLSNRAMASGAARVRRRGQGGRDAERRAGPGRRLSRSWRCG